MFIEQELLRTLLLLIGYQQCNINIELRSPRLGVVSRSNWRALQKSSKHPGPLQHELDFRPPLEQRKSKEPNIHLAFRGSAFGRSILIRSVHSAHESHAVDELSLRRVPSIGHKLQRWLLVTLGSLMSTGEDAAKTNLHRFHLSWRSGSFDTCMGQESQIASGRSSHRNIRIGFAAPRAETPTQ